MSLSDKLQQLDQLLAMGTLTETEFWQARLMACGTEKWREVRPEDVQWNRKDHPVTFRLGRCVLGFFIFLMNFCSIRLRSGNVIEG